MFELAYALYLIISIGMTIWVARVLSSSGETFLVRCFGQDEELARSTNRLLVIGFYLVNIGFICLRLKSPALIDDALVPAVGSAVGLSVLVLGGMHFFNMAMIARYGRLVNAWLAERHDAEEYLAKVVRDIEPKVTPPSVPTRGA